MKPHPIASALILLAASVAAGQAPSAVVVGPSKGVPVGGAVVLDASASVSSVPLVWKVEPPTPLLSLDVPPKRLAIFQQPEAGEYIATAMALGLSPDGKPIGDVVTVRFWVLGPAPIPPTPPPSPPPGPPTPDPAPDDKPRPTPAPPVSGKMYATLIYSLADPARGAPDILQAGLLTTLAQDNCVWHAWPESAVRVDPAGKVSPQTIVVEQNYQPSIDAAGGLPAVIFQDSTGKILAAIRAGSAADVVAKVKGLRGGAR